MNEKVAEGVTTLLSNAEFWSTISGAVVGGLIAYFVQVKALREGRRQRNEDNKRVQQAQAHSILFKMIRIYSDFNTIHRYIEGCYERAALDGFSGEPWQFVLPLANLPDPVRFSADEMGMLLALKKDDVFNLVAPLDVIHNSLCDALKTLNIERRALTERLKPDEVNGAVVSGVLNKLQRLALEPRIIEVNTLIEAIRTSARSDEKESRVALIKLRALFREKLGLTYKLEIIGPANEPPP